MQILLQTLCGCEKVMDISSEMWHDRSPVRVAFMSKPIERSSADPTKVAYGVRDFVHRGEFQRDTPIYREMRSDMTDWKKKYERLYKDVYAVDEGL